MPQADARLTPPKPVRLARLCLAEQVVILLAPIPFAAGFEPVFALDGTAAVLALAALIAMVRSRRAWVRLAAVWLQLLIAVRQLAGMFGESVFVWSALGLLVAGAGATQLLTLDAEDWFDRRRERAEPVLEEADVSYAELMSRMERDGVIWRAYAGAARHLVWLIVPTLLVFLPIGLVAMVSLALVADGSVVVVNGAFVLAGPPGPPLLGWAAAVLAVSAVAQAVVLPATVLIAVGWMTGTHVSGPAALRAAVRRWPAMLVLVLLGVVGFVLVVAAGIGMLWWSETAFWAYAAMAVVALFTMPCLLAVAVLMVEGGPVWGALGRAYRLTAGASWATAFTLAFGVLVFPALVQRAVDWAAGGAPLVAGALTSVLALLVPPFQAAVIARQYLRRLASTATAAGFGRFVDDLPGGAPRPAGPVPVLAALLLPGLLYAVAPTVNPLGWPEVSQSTATESWTSVPDPGGGEREPQPYLGDVQALYEDGNGGLVMVLDTSAFHAAILRCSDSTCADARLAWAEPVDSDWDMHATAARLPDGRIVMTTWPQQGREDDYTEWRSQLRLLLCDATACEPGHYGEPVTKVNATERDRLAALAVRPAGGLVVAHVKPFWRDHGTGEEVYVTVCDDPACARPRTREVAELKVNPSSYHRHHLLAAVGPGDRPVIARFDHYTNAITVISCDDPSCAETSTGRPFRGVDPDLRDDGYRSPAGAALVVRADGRPVIAYQDVADGAIGLLDCHDRQCSRADTVTLSAPGPERTAPALVLDRDGRALVAYQDLRRDQIVLAACTGTNCVHIPVAKTRDNPGDSLAMTLDRRGRPVIVWSDEGELMVTVPHDIPATYRR